MDKRLAEALEKLTDQIKQMNRGKSPFSNQGLFKEETKGRGGDISSEDEIDDFTKAVKESEKGIKSHSKFLKIDSETVKNVVIPGRKKYADILKYSNKQLEKIKDGQNDLIKSIIDNTDKMIKQNGYNAKIATDSYKLLKQYEENLLIMKTNANNSEEHLKAKKNLNKIEQELQKGQYSAIEHVIEDFKKLRTGGGIIPTEKGKLNKLTKIQESLQDEIKELTEKLPRLDPGARNAAQKQIDESQAELEKITGQIEDTKSRIETILTTDTSSKLDAIKKTIATSFNTQNEISKIQHRDMQDSMKNLSNAIKAIAVDIARVSYGDLRSRIAAGMAGGSIMDLAGLYEQGARMGVSQPELMDFVQRSRTELRLMEGRTMNEAEAIISGAVTNIHSFAKDLGKTSSEALKYTEQTLSSMRKAGLQITSENSKMITSFIRSSSTQLGMTVDEFSETFQRLTNNTALRQMMMGATPAQQQALLEEVKQRMILVRSLGLEVEHYEKMEQARRGTSFDPAAQRIQRQVFAEIGLDMAGMDVTADQRKLLSTFMQVGADEFSRMHPGRIDEIDTIMARMGTSLSGRLSEALRGGDLGSQELMRLIREALEPAGFLMRDIYEAKPIAEGMGLDQEEFTRNAMAGGLKEALKDTADLFGLTKEQEEYYKEMPKTHKGILEAVETIQGLMGFPGARAVSGLLGTLWESGGSMLAAGGAWELGKRAMRGGSPDKAGRFGNLGKLGRRIPVLGALLMGGAAISGTADVMQRINRDLEEGKDHKIKQLLEQSQNLGLDYEEEHISKMLDAYYKADRTWGGDLVNEEKHKEIIMLLERIAEADEKTSEKTEETVEIERERNAREIDRESLENQLESSRRAVQANAEAGMERAARYYGGSGGGR